VRARRLWFSQRRFLSLIFLMLLGPTASADELIRVLPGFSRLLRLDRPVGTVIVGNPDIADVTIQSEKAVVLTAQKGGREHQSDYPRR
jgi:Flp pilus assembly secretin CpaC